LILVPLVLIILTIVISNNLWTLVIYGQQQEEEKHQQYFFIDKWDSEGSKDGQLKGPHSIDVDPKGHVYVADSGNNRVQKFTTNGEFITRWGNEGVGDGQFKGLHDVSVDSSGEFVYTVELIAYRNLLLMASL
jgi:hypothetical protein